MVRVKVSGNVVRVHEIEGSSRVSWEAAAKDAVKQAKAEVPDPIGLDVVRLWADVKARKVTVFHAVVRIAYRQRLVPEPRRRAAR